ncbi:MAG TPA: cytochrome B, partial [Burkholderiales bacterium]|nr:cytochrome B [Burkholderiales bacterium]
DLERFSGTVDLLGGVRVIATIHVALFIFFTAFIFVHVYLASLGPRTSTHFKAMLTGYEELEEPPAK